MDHAKRILDGRGVRFPRNIMIQADNTTREQRNPYLLVWQAWCAQHEIHRTIGQVFYDVGHTHNEVDQRFTAVRTALSRATILQTPQDRKLLDCVSGSVCCNMFA